MELHLGQQALIKIIRAYQATISPDHGWFRHQHPYGYCRFYPTCSEYGVKAIIKYGVVVGSAKAAYRVLRCNPYSQGGIDDITIDAHIPPK